MESETLVSVFDCQAEKLADTPALRVKRDGVYRDVLWRELAERVRASAAGLLAAGVQPGDRVGLLSENRQEWIEADLAILSVGAITVGPHAPLTAEQVREQFRDSAPVLVFVSNAGQRDKLRSVRAELPTVRRVFVFEESAADGDFEPLRALIAEGGAKLAKEPHCLPPRIAAVKPDDLAALIYTSGTTGESKGVMLTHHNFVSNLRACEKTFLLAPDDGETVVLVYLPLSHVYARLVDYYLNLAAGRVIALAESVDTLLQNLQETRPHYISGVPRVHEKLAALARPLFEAGNRDALRQILGGRMIYCGAGGAALSPDVARFYFAAGVPIYQGYGLTETSPVVSFSNEEYNRIGAVGVALAGVEIQIAPDGEILSRGPHIMKGYWNKPEASARVMDADGWFHTGDIGRLDEEGFLFITDRKKDILVTAYGKNVAPQQIEGLLCFDPFIEQACVYGDSKKYLTALIVPALPALKLWAGKNGLDEKPIAELIVQPEVHALYEERVAKALCSVSRDEQVRRFLLLPEPFSFDRGEMTVTAKLRRRQVVEHYREALEALYEEEVPGK
jgi:long-chain acyl-CoA synthetase